MGTRRQNVQTKELLSPIEGPELVIGLVGAIGTELDQVTKEIEEELVKVGYEPRLIRVSQLIHEFKKYAALKKLQEEDERIDEYMTAGNEIRKRAQRGDAMALLSIAAIKSIRRSRTGTQLTPDHRIAYVLRSLKNPEEIRTLRKVYGRGFIQISAFSPREQRKESLARQIARSRKASDRSKFRATAERLIERDEAERDEDYGQNVRNTFPLADVVIPAHNRDLIKSHIARFIQAYFGHQFHTPTVDEYGMYLAKAAALRSADLSRQVGASILTTDGEIVSVGCNEVPKASGGQYWPNDANDMRDFKVGYDSSARIKREMLGEVLDRLKNAGWLSTKVRKHEIEELVRQAIDGGVFKGETNPLVAGAQLMDVLEFGRIVHAEMAAITEAARLSRSVKGATLYCTTFPCHICARHIVASGIERVVYVEPYPKSMAAELYPDSISIYEQGLPQEEAGSSATVSFESFAGIAPRRFGELFEMRKRKEKSGDVIRWREADATPRLERLFPAYLWIETKAIENLGALLKTAKL